MSDKADFRLCFPENMIVKRGLNVNTFAEQNMSDKISHQSWLKVAESHIFIFEMWPDTLPYNHYTKALNNCIESKRLLVNKNQATYQDEIRRLNRTEREIEAKIAIEEINGCASQMIGAPSI